MTLSVTKGEAVSGFEVTHAALADATVATATAAERLSRDRDAATRQVAALLDGGWRGEAARTFGEAWDDWVAGSQDVIDGLAAMADLLAVTQVDYVDQDEQSRRRLDGLAGTLVERLG